MVPPGRELWQREPSQGRGGAAAPRSLPRCWASGGSPDCLGEGKPPEWFLASQAHLQAWCIGWLARGIFTGRIRSSGWTLGRASTETVCVGRLGRGVLGRESWAWFPAVRFGLLSYYPPLFTCRHLTLRLAAGPLFSVDVLLPGLLEALPRGLSKGRFRKRVLSLDSGLHWQPPVFWLDKYL